MTVKLSESGAILLIDDCPAEDADLLLQHLLPHPDAPIEWSRCTGAHTAVIQVLLAAGRVPTGVPDGAFLKTWIGPALKRSQTASSVFPGGQGDAKQLTGANSGGLAQSPAGKQ